MADVLASGDIVTLVLPDGRRIARSAKELARLSRTTVPALERRLVVALQEGVVEFHETEELTFHVSDSFVHDLAAQDDARAQRERDFQGDLLNARERARRRVA